MDDTAQNTAVRTVQQPIVSPVVQPQVVSPVQQPPIPPASPVTGGRPEQAPGATGLPPREAAPTDEAEAVTTATDDSASQPDGVSDAADVQHETSADIPIAEAHPAVEAATLKEAGVKPGEDAEQHNREEGQLIVQEEEATKPDTQASAAAISLNSSPEQVKQVAQKSRIRDSLKWFATVIMYQWKKLQANSPKTDAPVVEEVNK